VRVFPGGAIWRAFVRLILAPALAPLANPIRRYGERLSREVITECLMVLSLPDGTALRLGRWFSLPVDEYLRSPDHPELLALRLRFASATSSNASVDDWSEFDQRMQFITQLFCALHRRADLFSPPFTQAQVHDSQAGRVPDGRL